MPLSSPNPARLKIWIVFFAVVLGLLAPVRAQETAVTGKMPEDYLPVLLHLLQAALKQSPQMITSEIGIERGQAGIYSNNAALWPQLSGGVQYAGNRASTENSPIETEKGLFYNIGLSQNVFAWGALANQSRIGRIDRAISQKNYAQGYLDLANLIRNQYMALIGEKIVIRNDRFSLKLAAAALAAGQQQLKNGQTSAGEINALQLDADGAGLELARAEEVFAGSKRSLANLAGLEDLADQDIPVEIPPPSYTPGAAQALLASFTGEGAQNTIQAQVYEMGIREAELNYKIQKVRLLPKISLGTSYFVQNQTTATNNSTTAPPVSVTIKELTYDVAANWSIFDGYATRGAKLAALAQKRQAEQQLKTYVATTLEQARHAERLLSFAARYMDLTDRRWQSADAIEEHAEAEFKLGSGSQNTVDQALAGLNSADYTTAAGRADFLSQWSEFISLVGRDPIMNNLPPAYVRDLR
jgi:outer membrane protein TolC